MVSLCTTSSPIAAAFIPPDICTAVAVDDLSLSSLSSVAALTSSALSSPSLPSCFSPFHVNCRHSGLALCRCAALDIADVSSLQQTSRVLAAIIRQQHTAEDESLSEQQALSCSR